MAKHGGWVSAVPGEGTSSLAVWLLALGVAACSGSSNAAGDGPIVRLHLSPVDMTATQSTLNITASDLTGQDRQFSSMFSSGALDPLGVTFPPGTRGPTSYAVTLLSDAACQVSTGLTSLDIDSDRVFDLTVVMSAVPLCGNGAKLTVQVAHVNGGTGRVTSTPSGIDCQGSGSGCSATFPKGTQVTLAAQADMGSFAGWSGAGCGGAAGCTTTLSEDAQVQAVFSTCRGWCNEQLPFAVTANLNGVSGTAANNVLVVGDGGTAIRWDGTAWQQLTPPSGNNVTLRGVAGKIGGSVISVAGDGGTILQLTGTTWKTITNMISSAPLRAVAIGAGSLPSTFFVGDSTSALILANNGSSVAGGNVMSTVPLYAITQNPLAAKDDLYIVGAINGTKEFAESWDGKNSRTAQLVAPGATIAGNINAISCGTTNHFAAGDSGAIARRAASAMPNAWATVTSPTTNNLRGIWAGSDTYIYAVGDAGTILYYDGSSWMTVTSPTTKNLRAIWGSSPTNIYAVGDAGAVLHYLP